MALGVITSVSAYPTVSMANTLAPDLIFSNVPTCDGKFVSGFQILTNPIEWYVDARHANECFDVPVTILPSNISAYDVDAVKSLFGDRELNFRPRSNACRAVSHTGSYPIRTFYNTEVANAYDCGKTAISIVTCGSKIIEVTPSLSGNYSIVAELLIGKILGTEVIQNTGGAGCFF